MINGKEYFDRLAASWDEKFKPDCAKLEYILKIPGNISGRYILDVGTGTGVLVPFLHNADCSIDAIDISEKMLNAARAKFGETANFFAADMQVAELNQAYDLIICHNVYPHFRDKYQTLKNIKKHLQPDGKLLIAHSASREEINNRHRANEEVKADVLPPAAELARLAESAGLQKIYTEESEVYIYFGANQN